MLNSFSNFGPWFTRRDPMQSPLSSMVGPSIFEYLRDCPLVLSNFLHEVRASYGYEIDKSWGHKWGKNPFWGHFSWFLPISLHPVTKTFLYFIYILSLTLSNISRRLPDVQEKSGSGCIVGTRFLSFRLSVFLMYFHIMSVDAVVSTTWNLARMYSMSTYLKIKNDFFQKR